MKNFSQTDQPVLGETTEQESQVVSTPPVIDGKPSVPSASNKPYDLKLPNGWSKTSKTDVASCEAEGEAKIDTYVRGSQTIILYENGHPGGCDLKGLADVYLDYDFTESAEGISIDVSKIAQCTKEQSPDCPKGDGIVSVYIGNKESNNAKKLTKNAKTQKTYFFSITDTSVQPNFENQVKSLAALISEISF